MDTLLFNQEWYGARAAVRAQSAERVVADYIAGMTDQYAITKFSEYFLPQAWQVDGY